MSSPGKVEITKLGDTAVLELPAAGRPAEKDAIAGAFFTTVTAPISGTMTHEENKKILVSGIDNGAVDLARLTPAHVTGVGTASEGDDMAKAIVESNLGSLTPVEFIARVPAGSAAVQAINDAANELRRVGGTSVDKIAAVESKLLQTGRGFETMIAGLNLDPAAMAVTPAMESRIRQIVKQDVANVGSLSKAIPFKAVPVRGDANTATKIVTDSVSQSAVDAIAKRAFEASDVAARTELKTALATIRQAFAAELAALPAVPVAGKDPNGKKRDRYQEMRDNADAAFSSLP